MQTNPNQNNQNSHANQKNQSSGDHKPQQQSTAGKDQPSSSKSAPFSKDADLEIEKTENSAQSNRDQHSRKSA